MAPQPTEDVTIVISVLLGLSLGMGMLLRRSDPWGLPLWAGRLVNTLMLLPRIATVWQDLGTLTDVNLLVGVLPRTVLRTPRTVVFTCEFIRMSTGCRVGLGRGPDADIVLFGSMFSGLRWEV